MSAENGRMSHDSQRDSPRALWCESKSRVSARERRWLGVTTVSRAAWPRASRSNSSLFLRIGNSAPVFMGAYFSAVCSALEKLLLFLHLRPFIGVRRRRFALDDGFPDLGKISIDRNPV